MAARVWAASSSAVETEGEGDPAAWEREALRLCARYVDEVVLAFGLCPWAEPAWRAGRVGRAVCLLPRPRPEDCLPHVDAFAAARAPGTDIGLLLFPRTELTWAAFDGFAERVRRARPDSPFLVAAFHPDGAERADNPHQAVSFLRRTPDPMLQFVRAELITRVKAAQPDVSAQVAEHNFQAMTAAPGPSGESGAALLQAVVRELRADRAATYARLSGAATGGSASSGAGLTSDG